MTTKKRQYHPGDAANIFVRVLLSEAGKLAGGLNNEQWVKTLKFFDNCCAYTGKPLTEDDTEQEHAIPINRDHCGLHLYGNVVPATREANSEKGNKHYREFVKDDAARQKIEDFMAEAGYHERAKHFQGLQAYCWTQYEIIKALCKANTDYIRMLLPEGLRSEREKVKRSITMETDEDGDDLSSTEYKTIQSLAKACIRKNFRDEEILELVESKKQKTTIGTIQSIRSRMRQHDKGIPTNRELKQRSGKK